MSYQGKVYREQDGDTFVVASGGIISVESGGALTQAGTLTNSGTLANTGAITNTGTITNSSDGTIADAVSASVAAATLNPYGASIVGSSTAGARAYKLKKPSAAGMRKMLIVKGSTGAVTVASATAPYACNFNYSLSKITFGAASDGMALELFAPTTTTWCIVGYSTAAVTTFKCT